MICGTMVLSARMVSAQDLGAAQQLTAKWASADTVTLNWGAPSDTAVPVAYRVYAETGSVQTVNGNGWRLVKTESDTVAELALSDLHLTHAQTMSFFIMSVIVLSGDTLPGKASNLAVAIWNNTGQGEITLHFTSNPVETGTIGKAYDYHVIAVSNDSTSVLTYSLAQAPDGMKIDSTTGNITWSPLHSGAFVVNVQVNDNHGNTAHQEYTITVGSGDEFTSVTGIITDANTNKGIDGAQLTFTLVDTTSTIIRSFTANCANGGRFTINLPAGVFIVDAVSQGYYTTYLGNTESAPGTLLTVVLGTKDTIDITMKPLVKGNLFGKVTDAGTGSPIVGATVTAIYKGTGHDSVGIGIPGYGTEFTTQTGDGGNYSMQLHTGLYLVRADAKGYTGEWYFAVDSVSGAKVLQIISNIADTANFQLQAVHEEHACIISGTVFGAHDSAVAGAEVTITMVDRDGRDNDSLYSVTVKTNAAGEYRDTVICGATYIVFARKDGFIGLYWRNGHGPLDADRIHIENSVDGINFVLLQQSNSGTELAGTVYGCDSVRSPQPSEVTAYLSKEGRYIAVATVKTDSNGFFSFQDLVPGTYVIQAVPRNHDYAPGYYTDQNQCTNDWHDAARIQ
ncbi:MAG TPA: carboxypeptidase regulatory-like domain-containing protein, partial [Candidatus Kapabacteria bacterium]|nr:carboxypeptidase regulatory-like domain-containing protein [Candidatus Kapabacteria bacterium]